MNKAKIEKPIAILFIVALIAIGFAFMSNHPVTGKYLGENAAISNLNIYAYNVPKIPDSTDVIKVSTYLTADECIELKSVNTNIEGNKVYVKLNVLSGFCIKNTNSLLTENYFGPLSAGKYSLIITVNDYNIKTIPLTVQ